jgi:predicted peptidase
MALLGEEKRLTAIVEQRIRLRYLLYRPSPRAGSGAPAPLVLFLHGIGERGDDLPRVTKHGPPKLAEAGRAFPFFLVAPQCPLDSAWIFQLDALRALLRETIRQNPVDTTRVYLTGLSMGGFGTWHLAVENPNAFAAIVPICGGKASASGLDQRVSAIAHVPTRVYHGARDTVVLPRKSEEMVEALRAAGGNVSFTVYPDAEHDSWTRTYEDQALWDWMLAQRNTRFDL